MKNKKEQQEREFAENKTTRNFSNNHQAPPRRRRQRKIPEEEGRVAVHFRGRKMFEALHLRVLNVCVLSRESVCDVGVVKGEKI